MGLNWLITGGCGFIGTNLVRSLLVSGVENIRVLDNFSVGTEADLAGVCGFTKLSGTTPGPIQAGVSLVQGDILDEALVKSASESAHVIVHLAGNTGVAPSVEDPQKDCMANVVGTLNLLEAARVNGVQRFIFSSSGAPAGNVTPPIHEEIVPHPVSPYGASKLACEGYCSAYYHSFGVETVVLRFSNVYGPGSIHKNSVIAKFIKLALDGQQLEIFGDGSQTRDFVYVDDLVNAIRESASAEGAGGEVFQIATSRETTVDEMVSILKGAMESGGVKEVAVLNSQFRTGDVKRNFASADKARRILGWQADTPLEEGLLLTLDYFRGIET